MPATRTGGNTRICGRSGEGRRRLFPHKRVLTKERPHQARSIDATGGATDEPFRQRRATRPGVASSLDGVKHHGRIVSAVRICATSNIARHRRFDWVASAPISSRPTRRPLRGTRKRSGGYPRGTTVVRNLGIGCPMKRDHRNRSRVCAPSPRNSLRCRHLPDRRDSVGQRAGKTERHAAAVGKSVGENPGGVDVV